MNNKNQTRFMKRYLILLIIFPLVLFACKDAKVAEEYVTNLETNKGEEGTTVEIHFLKGKYHNHPTFSVWVEDLEGKYIETLYVTKYLGTGIFGHASLGDRQWDTKPGPAKRPSTLPYWLHKRNIKSDDKTYLPTPDKPVPDAITAATPKGDFVLKSIVKSKLPEKFVLLLEINQPFDWNEYWNNTKFEGEFDYYYSSQPAIVYSVIIDQSKKDAEYYLNPVGHSHYSGYDGELYTDLSTLTTAKEIAHKIKAKILK